MSIFNTQNTFGVESNPLAVAVGDFNGDGKLDLAVVNNGSSSVSVLLNNGTSFNNQPAFKVGSDLLNNPVAVAVGYINSDSKLDLAVVNTGTGISNTNVSVLLNNGTDFDPQKLFNVGDIPKSVAVGDFNGDGKLDLAVANDGSTNVSILLNDGNGGFNLTTLTFEDSPQSIAVGDFNGDGKLDLAVASLDNNDNGNISVLLNKGTQGFNPQAIFSVGNLSYSVAVGDFNGDGKLDLVVANSGSNNVSVSLNNGTGFDPQTTFSVGVNPQSIAVGDFNGDGKLDLAVANSGSADENDTPVNSNVSVLINKGTGDFDTQKTFSVDINSQLYSVAVGDFNGDGKLDLAVTDSYNNKVSVLLNTLPKISIAAGTNPVKSVTNGSFIITLDTPAPVGGLVVKYNTNGSNTIQGTDFSLIAGTNISNVTANTFIIAEGQTSATLNVSAVQNEKSNETVTLNLTSSSDYIVASGAFSSSTLYVTKLLTGNINNPRASILGTLDNDRIIGGIGSKTLTGGAGNDEFVFTQLADVGQTIADFKVGEDKIDLTQLLASIGYNGSNPINQYIQFVQGTGTHTNNTFLQIDRDGLGTSATFRNFLMVANITPTLLNHTTNFIF